MRHMASREVVVIPIARVVEIYCVGTHHITEHNHFSIP